MCVCVSVRSLICLFAACACSAFRECNAIERVSTFVRGLESAARVGYSCEIFGVACIDSTRLKNVCYVAASHTAGCTNGKPKLDGDRKKTPFNLCKKRRMINSCSFFLYIFSFRHDLSKRSDPCVCGIFCLSVQCSCICPKSATLARTYRF